MKETAKRILSYKKDFIDIPSYAEEINYLEPILADLEVVESILNDRKLAKIFSNSKFRRS